MFLYQAINFIVLLIAIEHLWIMGMEMFRWKKGFARDLAGLSDDEVEVTAKLAANQGLYNGFLSAGLIWTYILCTSGEGLDATLGSQLRVFFLLCVLAAGLYGGKTVNKRIVWMQAAPAFLGLVLIWIRG